jgi:hypothetical protein
MRLKLFSSFLDGGNSDKKLKIAKCKIPLEKQKLSNLDAAFKILGTEYFLLHFTSNSYLTGQKANNLT